jgi:hypothetical protein
MQLVLGVLVVLLLLVLLWPPAGLEPTKLTATATRACPGCAPLPGYEYRDGRTLLNAKPMPILNAMANKIFAEPHEILSKCMQGGQIQKHNLVPAVGCNQSSRCVGIEYDAEAGVCTLLSSYAGPDMDAPSATKSTYLKSCACVNGKTEADVVCGANVYGSQTCPTGSCYGDGKLTSYCCRDGNIPGGCTENGPGALTSGVFVPYQYYEETTNNFQRDGCVFEGTCPVISFSPVGSYNVNVYMNRYNAYSTRLRDDQAAEGKTKVAECRLENITCQNDCISEVAYIVGFPDDLPTDSAAGQPYCYRAPDPGTDLVQRTPDTLLLMKGRLMSLQMVQNMDTLSCAPFFSQDTILARLVTNSNRRDWVALFQRDKVLQAFLNDKRFPPTTKFYWHPGHIEDRTPKGIKVGSVHSTVWVDPASLNDTVQYCAGGSYLMAANEALLDEVPGCAVPFLAGCRTYTNPDGYFIPSGLGFATNNVWAIEGGSVGPMVFTPTGEAMYDATTRPMYRLPLGESCAAKDVEKSRKDGHCGTHCLMESTTQSSKGLRTGLCRDLDAQSFDSACSLALRRVVGSTDLYSPETTWCVRDDDNTLGLPNPSNPCFVNDLRKVMSGSSASALYHQQYAGTTSCDP